MSSGIRTLAESHRSIAREIDNFMWEEKPMRTDQKKSEHTKEELELKLFSIRERCWSMYDEIAEEMEWR